MRTRLRRPEHASSEEAGRRRRHVLVRLGERAQILGKDGPGPLPHHDGSRESVLPMEWAVR